MNWNFLRIACVLLATAGFVISKHGLEEASAHLAALGAAVPDLIVARSTEAYAAAFAGMSPAARAEYLHALWTWDVLFPLSYGVGLHLITRRDFVAWRVVPFLAMFADFGENVLATAMLNQWEGWRIRPSDYHMLNALKWTFLGVSALGALVSAVSFVSDEWRDRFGRRA